MPRNLTPNSAGRPGGLTLEQFLEVLTIGTDFDNAPPVVPGPHSPDLLQITPWLVFSKMTDRGKRAITSTCAPFRACRPGPHAAANAAGPQQRIRPSRFEDARPDHTIGRRCQM